MFGYYAVNVVIVVLVVVVVAVVSVMSMFITYPVCMSSILARSFVNGHSMLFESTTRFAGFSQVKTETQYKHTPKH